MMLMGLPGSGKSTWAAAQERRGWRVVSTDRLRAELFGDTAIQGPWLAIEAELRRQLRLAALDASYSGTIYDATNTQRKQRRRALAHCREAGFSEIWGLWFDLPLGLCLARNAQRDRRVPPEVIRGMARKLAGAPPRLEDGFDRLWVWDGGDRGPGDWGIDRGFGQRFG
jgi:predicted kinase